MCIEIVFIPIVETALPTDRGGDRHRPDGPRAATLDPRGNKRGGSVPFAELEDDNNLAGTDADAMVK